MTDLPVLPILLLTKYSPERDGIAEKTLKTIATLMDYSGGYKLYIADGSDSIEHAQDMDKIWANIYGGAAKIIHLQNTPGVVWNAAISQIFADGHQWYYRSEDDFLLKEQINIDPFAQILLDRDDVGMVRLGLMPDGLNLRSIGWTDSTGHPGIYFDCLPSTPYIRGCMMWPVGSMRVTILGISRLILIIVFAQRWKKEARVSGCRLRLAGKLGRMVSITILAR
jgi:hypothetical protein